MTSSRRGSTDPQISVSVVTYNSEACLPAFLDRLSRQESVSWEALFFDNGSGDGARDLIRKSEHAELLASDENVGYGRAHNHNLSRCRGRFVLLLNPDLDFAPDLFARLLKYMDAHPEYAFAGPRIIEGPESRPFPPRHFYPGEGMVALEPGLRRSEIAWLNGCCLIARRDALERLGGFDPDYFLYQAETDLCLRARRAGYRLGYADDSVVHHLHRQSQRGDSEYEYSRRLFEGSAVFWTKHYGSRDVIRMVRFQLGLSRMLLALGAIVRRQSSLRHVLGEARLRARRDICQEWLVTHSHRDSVRSSPERSDAGKTSIALRQARIAAEWIARRQFPLDDY